MMPRRTTSRILLAIFLVTFAFVLVVGVAAVKQGQINADRQATANVIETTGLLGPIRFYLTQTVIAAFWTSTPALPTPTLVRGPIPMLYPITASNIPQMVLVRSIPLSHAINTFAISPDSKIIGVGTSGGVFLFYVYAAADPLVWLDDANHHYNALAFSPDGKILAAGAEDGLIRLWDVSLRKQITQIQVKTDPPVVNNAVEIYSLAFSADGRNLVSGDIEGDIRLWDTKTFQQLERRQIPNDQFIRAVVYHPSRDILAAGGGWSSDIYMWEGSQAPRILKGHTGLINALTFAPSGDLLASASDDGAVKLWDLKTGGEKQSFAGLARKSAIFGASFNTTSDILAVPASGGYAYLIDVSTGKNYLMTYYQGDPIQAITFSPDSKLLCAGGIIGILQIWGVPSPTASTPKP